MKAEKDQEVTVHRLTDNGRYSIQVLFVPDNGWAESICLTPAKARRLAALLLKAASHRGA